MNYLLKKAKLAVTGIMALVFLVTVTLSSCGSKSTGNDEAGAAEEHPAATEEHPAGDDKAMMDSTAMGEEHPMDSTAGDDAEKGEEHPQN